LAQYPIKILKRLKTSQQIQSVDTTATVVTETFQAEEKILPQDLSPEKQYEFATSFFKGWRL
jgi:hypothetical protein